MSVDPALKIMTLGRFAVYLDGRPLTSLGSRKAEALLVYLASTNRPVSRDSLVALFWQNSPQDKALASLSAAVSALRKQLASHMVTTRQTVALNPESDCWLDTAVLGEHLRRWKETRSPETTADLEATLDLYQGEFLAGFHVRDSQGFEEWALLEGENLRHEVTQALLELVNGYLVSGQYRRGIDQARRLIHMDPLHEASHRLLMQLLARCGERNAALLQYESCRQTLADELGVEPAPETTDLYERIRLTSRGPRHNLPAQATSFIGRETELAQIQERLANPDCRLLTIVGAGGIGKTRLALQVAQAQIDTYLNGVWFVDLAPLDDPSLVTQEVAKTFGLGEGEARAAGREMESALIDRISKLLRSRELLLILDNCEHLLDACARLCGALLPACPDVTLLTTSRERIGVAGEVIWEAPSMTLPDEGESEQETWPAIRQGDAARLFLERAAAVRQDISFDQAAMRPVVRICRRLDGMPLAIELASSRLRMLSLSELETRLDNRFRLLTGGSRTALPRQQTLLATVQWSYDLLSEAEQRLFDRLSVFRGGFSLDAAETACAGEGLQGSQILELLGHLVDKSLVVTDESFDGSARFRLLETLREFSKSRPATSQYKDAIHRQHAQYYLALAEDAHAHLFGAEQRIWSRRLEMEKDNIRGALRWAIEAGEIEICLRFAAALWEGFWLKESYSHEGREWLKDILALSRGEISPLSARAILAAGALAWITNRHDQAVTMLQESLAMAGETDDVWVAGWSLSYMGMVKRFQGKGQEAVPFYEESLLLFRRLGDPRGIAWQLYHLGRIARDMGDHERALSYQTESLDLFREAEEAWGTGYSLSLFGLVAFDQGDYERAQTIFEEALAIFQELENKLGSADIRLHLGNLSALVGNYERAAEYYQERYDLARQIDYEDRTVDALLGLGQVAKLQGAYARAKTLLHRCLAYYFEGGFEGDIIDTLEQLAGLACAQGDYRQAAQIYGSSETLRRQLAYVRYPYLQAEYEREVAEIQEALGKEVFAQEWDKGAAMELETVIALTLGESEEPSLT